MKRIRVRNRVRVRVRVRDRVRVRVRAMDLVHVRSAMRHAGMPWGSREAPGEGGKGLR